jgi:hypothetical protein
MDVVTDAGSSGLESATFLSWTILVLTRKLLLFTSWTTDDLFIIHTRYVYISSILLLELSMYIPTMTSRSSYNNSWVWLVNVIISYSVPEVRSVQISSLAERYVLGFLPTSSFSLGLGRFHSFQYIWHRGLSLGLLRYDFSCKISTSVESKLDVICFAILDSPKFILPLWGNVPVITSQSRLLHDIDKPCCRYNDDKTILLYYNPRSYYLYFSLSMWWLRIRTKMNSWDIVASTRFVLDVP